MKRICIIVLAALLVLAMGCKQEASLPAPEELAAVLPEEEAPIVGPLSGGWSAAETFDITPERQAVFDKGMEGLMGANYAPVAYLGSQVVAGINHAFLVRGTLVVPDRPVLYALAYFYEDLQGAVKLMNVSELGIVPLENGTIMPPQEGRMGAWYYADDPTVTDEMRQRLDKTLAGMVGASYVPVANLGEQVVAGLNRCLLCQVSPVAPDARPHYALVFIYEDLQGGATLDQVIDLDIGALCSYGA